MRPVEGSRMSKFDYTLYKPLHNIPLLLPDCQDFFMGDNLRFFQLKRFTGKLRKQLRQ